jgi:hypothetical protein
MTKEKDSVCTSCQPEHEPQITPLCVNSFAESFGPVLLKPTDAAAQPINESLQQFEEPRSSLQYPTGSHWTIIPTGFSRATAIVLTRECVSFAESVEGKWLV